MSTLARQLHDHAQKQPDKTCMWLIHQQAPTQSIRYADLYQGALDWMHALQTSGIGAGDIVVVIRQHDADMIYAFWGAILLGAVPSMLPFPTDTNLIEKRRKIELDDFNRV